MIEAKIIEVYLEDSSRLGLDWSSILDGGETSGITGTVTFGNAGVVYPHSGSSFISEVTLDNFDFTVFLNALDEQGDAKVLANPKLTVLNGQPAMISVGTDITYIKEIEAEEDDDDNSVTYSVETDSVVEGIALGVLASVVDDNSVILHLTPITTDLVTDPIETETFGLGSVGLPRTRIRDMSTMVQVQNGEMLIIGGLIDSVESKEGKFAPGVGNIPLIKYLFGYEAKIEEKRELVILLTPRII